MRPISKDYIFSWSNAKEAEGYKGEEGFFANSLDELIERISYESPSSLLEVQRGAEVDKVFLDSNRGDYGLFIPLVLMGVDFHDLYKK
jgi:hypothetical protein